MNNYIKLYLWLILIRQIKEIYFNLTNNNNYKKN
jgi:hypothetical protein